jgi:hypothetical protein
MEEYKFPPMALIKKSKQKNGDTVFLGEREKEQEKRKWRWET